MKGTRQLFFAMGCLLIAPVLRAQTALMMQQPALADQGATIPVLANDGFVEVPEFQTYRKGPEIRFCLTQKRQRVVIMDNHCAMETRTEGSLLSSPTRTYQPSEDASAQEYLDSLFGKNATQFVGVGIRGSRINDTLVIFYKIPKRIQK